MLRILLLLSALVPISYATGQTPQPSLYRPYGKQGVKKETISGKKIIPGGRDRSRFRCKSTMDRQGNYIFSENRTHKRGPYSRYTYLSDQSGNVTRMTVFTDHRWLGKDTTVTRYSYDGFSRVTESRNDKGLRTCYAYDAYGRLVQNLTLGPEGDTTAVKTFRYEHLSTPAIPSQITEQTFDTLSRRVSTIVLKLDEKTGMPVKQQTRTDPFPSTTLYYPLRCDRHGNWRLIRVTCTGDESTQVRLVRRKIRYY